MSRATRAHARNEAEAGFVAHIPAAVDVRAIHAGLGQPEFAPRFGFSVAALRDWERGRHLPDPAARVLLTVIAAAPEAVDRVHIAPAHIAPAHIAPAHIAPAHIAPAHIA